MARKIDVAVSSMDQFLTAVFGANDRYSVSAFDVNYRSLLRSATSESQIKNVLSQLRSNCSGGTSLYEAIAFAIGQFIDDGDKSHPWILIILTDGDDTDSKHV